MDSQLNDKVWQEKSAKSEVLSQRSLLIKTATKLKLQYDISTYTLWHYEHEIILNMKN